MRDKLTLEELAFFKNQGYLIVEDLLNLELCGQIKDLLWSELPEHVSLVRDDPRTHIGPFNQAEADADANHLRQGFHWRLRKVAGHPLLKRLVFAKNLVQIAEQFLGQGMVHRPTAETSELDATKSHTGIRGVYCVLPYGDYRSDRTGFHTDGHPFHLGMVAALDDIEERGAGFRVWPGSHKRFYPTFALQYDQPRIPSYDHLPSVNGIYHPPAFLEESKRVLAEVTPVDCSCPAGSVVYWHHRVGHGNGPNYSERIRAAVLADYSKTDLDACRAAQPHADMWHDWGDQIKTVSAGYSSAFARRQRLSQ